jgi:beta-mannosidase
VLRRSRPAGVRIAPFLAKLRRTMNENSKHHRSRRQFIKLTAGGVGIGVMSAFRVEPAHSPNEQEQALNNAWMSPSSGAVPDIESATQNHQTLSLNGTWSVAALPLDAEGGDGYRRFLRDRTERTPAQVPGEIHLDLMRVGRMADPSISDNARARCRWPEQHSWWYRTEFIVPEGFRRHLRQQLIFEGIDLFGQIFVNGRLAGSTENAFAAAVFDVKSLLREGMNELVVRVTSGMELIPPRSDDKTVFGGRDSTYFIRFWDVHRSLRKPDYSAYGHDWCDPLPNIGIWRGVRLEGRTQVIIDFLRLDTAITGQEVTLEGEVRLENLHPWSEIPVTLELRVEPPRGTEFVQRLAIGVPVGLVSVPCRFVIPEAQLWWPNGMGNQPLYRVTVRVICDGNETDRHAQNIGLRTLELDRSQLPEGSRFCFKVNGQEVFCKGGNWAPADLIPARVDTARYQSLISEAKNAHMTMLIVNGVGIYEHDDFFDACDRAGILVWQQFAFSDGKYPDHDAQFMDLVRAEAETSIRRLRHHPSLAMWCGNSECTWLMADVWKCDVNDPQGCGGERIYNELLPALCQYYDPARPYWPGCPFGGTSPNSDTAGDRHGPYGMMLFGDMADEGAEAEEQQRKQAVIRATWQQLADRMRARFVSETGVIGPPNIASIREYLRPTEQDFGSLGWRIHTNQMETLVGTTLAGISYHFGAGLKLTVPQFVLYGQLFQAQHVGGIVEAMRFRKHDPRDDCQGVIIWSFNDCWGEIGWSILDHYLRRKASFYAFRRAAAPVKVLVRSRGEQLVTRVVNDTLRPYTAVVCCGWVRVDGTARELKRYSIPIPANSAVEVARESLPSSPVERDPRAWVYAATLSGGGIPEDQAIWLLCPFHELDLQKPLISVTTAGGMLEVQSLVYCHGVHLDDEGREVLSDNYFDLLPSVPRRIPITNPVDSGAYLLTAVMPLGVQPST